MAETSSFAHEIILKFKGRILVIIKGKIKLVALKLFCGVYIYIYIYIYIYMYISGSMISIFSEKRKKR